MKHLKGWKEINELHSSTYYSAAKKLKEEGLTDDKYNSFMRMGDERKSQEVKSRYNLNKFANILIKNFPEKYNSRRKIVFDIKNIKWHLHINSLKYLFSRGSTLYQTFIDLLKIDNIHSLGINKYFLDPKNVLEEGKDSELSIAKIYETFLSESGDKERFDLIKTLIDSGYNVNVVMDIYNMGLTPLSFCAASGIRYNDIAFYILDNVDNVDINHISTNGDNALSFASYENNIDLVKKLLSKDAKLTDENRNELISKISEYNISIEIRDLLSL